MIVDGRRRFGCSLSQFYRRPDLVMRVARRGILIPPTDQVDTSAEPALARVNPLPDGSVRWIAVCPDCLTKHLRRAAEYVWLATPIMFCVVCGNASIGGKWRPVTVPSNRKEIERLLLLRPDPMTRGWEPGETIADLKADNEKLLSGEA